MDKIFISNKLIKMTLLLGITLFCNTNTYATTTSLKDLFNDQNKTIDFTGDVIKVNGEDITDTTNSDEFMVTSNNSIYTTYINTKTLPIQNSLGGGVVLASISGSNNLSLQNWTEDSKVPTSITFSGNNTQYTGILYLHPSINTITFTDPNSIIKNINFPNSIINPNTEDTDNPFIKHNERRIIKLIFKSNNNNININELTIGDNLILNLRGNLNINKLNLNNKSLLKLISSNINIKKSSTILPSINISNDEYVPIEYVEPTIFIPDDNTIAAKFDYSVGEKGTCLYYYPKNVNCTCGKLLSLKPILPQQKLLSNSDIIQYLKPNICNNCKNTIDATIINPTLVYYLIPCYLQNDNIIQLHCFNCLNNRCSYYSAQLGWIYLATYCDEIKIQGDIKATHFCNDGKCIYCNVNVVYNKEYVEDQLQKMKIPQQWLDHNHICSTKEITYDDFYEWYEAYANEFDEKLANGSLLG